MTSFAQRIRDDSDDIRYYGVEPQITARSIMLELRTKDGRRKAYPYCYITEAELDPEVGITIFVADVIVTIRGRKLEEVFSYLLTNRLCYVQEDYSGQDSGESKIFVEAIEITQRGMEGPI